MAGDSITDSPSPSPSPSPTKRLKLAAPNPKSDVQQLLQLQSPEESNNDSDSEICGICLSDGGGRRRAIRGKTDSCDHFFCFVCIMEWAKVESRCPMCKRRFTAIHRPPKLGLFAFERIVNVPQRDQVYLGSHNGTSGPSDPYAHVKCSVCLGITNESLLLLCDLCDSAAHTYCVGLGATVPDGDWFCHDCALSRSEHEKTELDADIDDRIISGNSNVELPAVAEVSIFDIVRESSVSVLRRQKPCASSSGSNLADEGSGPSKRSRDTVGNSTESGARTLGLCRNVHSRIQALRENWHAIQNRSLSFSSSVVEGGGGSRRRGKVTAVFDSRSSEPQSSSSRSQQSNSQYGFVETEKDVYDTDTAWKMMKIAKSMQKNCKRTSSLSKSSAKPSCPGSDSKGAISSSGLHISKIQPMETRNEERTGKQKHYKNCYYEREKEKHKSLQMEKQKSIVMNSEFGERVLTSHSPQFSQSPSSIKFQIHYDDCHVKDVRQFVKNAQNSSGETSTNAKKECGSSCSTSLVGSVLRGSEDSLGANLDAGLKLDKPEGSTKSERGCSRSEDRKVDNAKTEIQSLVKLNLKLLSQDKRLGVDAFKEIARLATHTILAACGFQHSKSIIHSFPSSVCSHSEDIKLRRKSTLMPNSCRECFYVFVKNIVCSIMIEKGHIEPL